MVLKLKDTLNNAKLKIKNNISEYKNFLKTAGNNYKYTAQAQLSLFAVRPTAVACAEYDFWQKNVNRRVNNGEIGIPIPYITKSGNVRTKYVFDVSQTSHVGEIDKFKLWTYNENIHSEAQSIIEKTERIRQSLQDISMPKVFLEEQVRSLAEKSIEIMVNTRLGIKDEIVFSEQDKSFLTHLFIREEFDTFFEQVSERSKEIINEISNEIKNINSAERTSEEEREVKENVGRSEQQEVQYGRWDLRSSNEENIIRGEGRRIQVGTGNGQQQNIDTEYRNATAQSERAESLGENETGIFEREQGESNVSYASERGTGNTFTSSPKRSKGINGKINNTDSERAENNRRTETGKSNEMGKSNEQHLQSGTGNSDTRSDREKLITDEVINSFLSDAMQFEKIEIYNFFTSVKAEHEKVKYISNFFKRNESVFKKFEEENIGRSYGFEKNEFIIEAHNKNGIFSIETVTFNPFQIAKKIETLIENDVFLTLEEQDLILSLNESIEDINETEILESLEEEEAIEISNTSPQITTSTQENFRITEELQIQDLPPSERLQNNLEAIRILNKLELEDRKATSEEKTALAKYVGWGGLALAFDETIESGQWKEANDFLRENLSVVEYENARESTLTAFFTPKYVIDAMYEGLSNLGFEEGNILEPSLGVGNFLENLPEKMQNSNFVGSELDTLSGRIAQKLYPQAQIRITGFEKLRIEHNSFDIAIGNVPFGDFRINDDEMPSLLIHDYFFEKSLSRVKEGGVIAFITSSGTLDKTSEDTRKRLSENAKLLGAVRLPTNVFKGTGTEVVSDIIFLQKKTALEKEQTADEIPNWLSVGTDEKGFSYNNYFIENPDMVIGEIKETTGPFGKKLTCIAADDLDLENAVKTAIANGVKGIYNKENSKVIDLDATERNFEFLKEAKNLSYVKKDGKIYFVEDIRRGIMKEVDMKPRELERISAYIEVAQAARSVIKVQITNGSDSELSKAQAYLDKEYDKFVAEFGYVSSRYNNSFLNSDPNYYLLSSLEIFNGDVFVRKSDFFTKRTISYASDITSVETSEEALRVSLSQKGEVNLDYMSEISGRNVKMLIEELKGQIFPLPSYDMQKYVSADEYLSGNIRKKIRELEGFERNLPETLSADERTKIQETINFNLSALTNALPPRIEASDIEVELGAAWIPAEVIADFVGEKFEMSDFLKERLGLKYSDISGEWDTELNYVFNNKADSVYGTSRANGIRILKDCLNLRDTRIYDTKEVFENGNYKKKSILNHDETTLAQQKQDLLKEEFKAWIFKDLERREMLTDIYNEVNNSVRVREFDGSNLTFSGMNPEIELRTHQKDAIARILYGENTLLAHVVGAGKTFEMVGSCMEAKRLGLINKAMLVVPNHLTEQMGREFLQLYPAANILVATKKDFEKKNRKKLVARIATGNYDAVIIGHSQFEKIPMSKQFQENFYREQIKEITTALLEYENSMDNSVTVKALEKTKKSLTAKLEKLQQTEKDDVVDFEELGIDKLYVDEAHYYKNLFLYTKMRNVAGIGQTEAQKTNDMFMKCRYMDKKTGGKGIVFATGTPVSNSMSELYTMQKYLQYDELKESGKLHFDAWASTFGKTVTAIELSPEGTGFRSKTRFAKFFNLPELMNNIKQFADIKTSDMLNLPTPDADYKKHLTKPSRYQKEMLEVLAERAEKVRNREVKPEEDNMLKITNDGKKLALDQRLLDINLPDDPNSKVNGCVSNVFDIWEKTLEDKLSQLIFCDMSTPIKKKTSKEEEESAIEFEEEKFSVYNDIKEKLIEKGIPENEIAFIHDANTDKQKDELFAKVRRGDVRVLMGSTQKMGAGTNVQNKLIAMHDLDVPWRPADLEQRAGRIVRQGNENDKVEIYRYITENTFDAYLWQTIENKQKFISQIMTSKEPVRVAEDVDGAALNYAEIKALATGNPLIKEKMELDVDVAKLSLMEANYRKNQYEYELQIKKSPEKIKECERMIVNYENDLEFVSKNPFDFSNEGTFEMKIGDKVYKDKTEAGAKLKEQILKSTSDPIKIGEYREFEIYSAFNYMSREYRGHLKRDGAYFFDFGLSASGNIQRINNVIEKNIANELETVKKFYENYKERYRQALEDFGKPFEKEEELKQKKARLSEINRTIENQKTENTMEKQPEEKVAELNNKTQNYQEEEKVTEIETKQNWNFQKHNWR